MILQKNKKNIRVMMVRMIIKLVIIIIIMDYLWRPI